MGVFHSTLFEVFNNKHKYVYLNVIHNEVIRFDRGYAPKIILF